MWKKIKLMLLAAVLLLVTTTASAEMVVQQPFTLVTDEYIREGLYTGEMTDGRPDGYGVFCAANDDGVAWHYIGFWAAGLMQGQGGTYWDNGSVEIGEYRCGILVHGQTIDGDGAKVKRETNKQDDTASLYIGNKNTRKFHEPTCSSVADIKESNKVPLSSREEAVSSGYKPCGRCKP